MEYFQKLNGEEWLKNTFYKATQEENDILMINPTSNEEKELVQNTILSVNAKAFVAPTEEELAWCENIYNFLMISINSADFQYSLVGINLTQDITENQGIKFNGILNYYNGEEFCQYRF